MVSQKLWDKTKYGEKVTSLVVAEIALLQSKLVDSKYQQKSRVLNILTLNNTQLSVNVEPNNLMFLKTYNTEFSDITITFEDHKCILLEIEDKIRLKLLI